MKFIKFVKLNKHIVMILKVNDYYDYYVSPDPDQYPFRHVFGVHEIFSDEHLRTLEDVDYYDFCCEV